MDESVKRHCIVKGHANPDNHAFHGKLKAAVQSGQVFFGEGEGGCAGIGSGFQNGLNVRVRIEMMIGKALKTADIGAHFLEGFQKIIIMGNA